MPRAPLIRSETHSYHVTARTNNKIFFPLHLSEAWKIFVEELTSVVERCQLRVHAFVLMDNHFHLLVQTPQANLDVAMQIFMRNTAVKVMARHGGANHLWGGRYKWTLIDSAAYYYQVYRYIYQNPLRAGIVKRVEEYPYSTLHTRVSFPLYNRLALEMGGEVAELLWLNERIESDGEKLIRYGLRRAQFDVNKKKLKAFEKLKWPKGE